MATYTITTTPEEDAAIAEQARVQDKTEQEVVDNGAHHMLASWVQMMNETPHLGLPQDTP